MFKKDDPVGKTVEMGAALFAIVADTVIKECGKEVGENIVRKAVKKYAVMRANKIKNQIIAEGKEVTFDTVEEYSDYPTNCAWNGYCETKDNCFREVTDVCPFSTAFRELKLGEVGRLYCDVIDITMFETYFGDIEFERLQIFTDGPDTPCEMVVKIKKENM